MQIWSYPSKLRELSWNVTSRYLATDGGNDITIWDYIRSPEGSQPITLTNHVKPLTALQFQRAGPLLASAVQDGRLVIWQPAKSARPVAGASINSPLSQIAWSPNNQWLALGTENGGIAVMAKPHCDFTPLILSTELTFSLFMRHL